MKRLLIVLAFALSSVPAAKAETPDVFWSLLGGEASPQRWTTIFEEDQPDRPRPHGELARLLSVAHQPVGRDRQLFRFRFDRPMSPEWQSLQIYLDADADESTGRQEGFEGTDDQVGLEAADGRHEWVDFQYMHDGFRRPGNLAWAGQIGSDAYFVIDTPVADEGGRASARLSWATQVKDTRGQGLAAEREAFATFDLGPTPPEPAQGTVALPYPLTTAADAVADPPRIDKVQLYRLDGRTNVIARLNWVGPVVARYETPTGGGETPPTLANRLHRVSLPADATRVTLRALTTGFEWVDAEPATLAEAKALKVGGSLGPIPVLATNPTDQPLAAYPHRLGVPIPKGSLADVGQLRLADDDGNGVPADFGVLSRWDDGSVRWASADFLADLPAGGDARFVVTQGKADGGGGDGGVQVTNSDDGVRVDTGRLSFELSREPFLALRRVRVDGRDLGDLDLRGTVVGVDGETFTTDGGLDDLTVEDADGTAASVVARGRHVGDGGSLLAWRMTFRVWAGSPLLEVQHVFGIDDTASESTKFKSLVLDVGLTGEAPEQAVWQRDERQYEVTVDGQTRVRTGGHEGVFDLGGGATLAVRDFWQNYPKRVATRDNRLFIGLAPELPAGEYDDEPQDLVTRLFLSMRGGVYEFMQGLQRRHTLLFDFGGRATPSLDTLARTTPDAYADSGAMGPMLAEADLPRRYAEYGDFARSMLDRYVDDRRQKRAYGLMNWGDWYGERRYNWGNNEYDGVHGLLGHYAMLGDLDFLREGSLMAEHLVDVDIRHHARDPRQVGSTYIHLVGHTGGYFGDDWREAQRTITPGAFTAVDIQNWGHYWGEGLMLHGWLRADLRTLDTLEDVAGRVATTYINRPIGEWRNPRQQGWTLKVPVAAYKTTGDPYYLLAAETIVDALLDRQDATGGWSVELRDTAASPGGMSYGSTNFPIGIVVSSLARYHELTGDERVADSIVRGARWLIEDLWESGTPIGFRYSSSPGNSGGSNFYHIAYAVAYAHSLVPDRTFADVTLAYSDAYLTEPIGDTHEFGKPFAQRIREVVPTMPLLKNMLATPHVGLSARSAQQWVVKLPAGETGETDETEHDLLRVVGRGQGEISAELRVRSLGGRTLLEQTVRGQGDVNASLDVSSLPAGELLELTLQPLGGEAWDVQLVRGGQMLSLADGPVVGAAGVEPRLRFEVPPGTRRFSVEAAPAGGSSPTVDVLDPNGDVVASAVVTGKRAIDVPVSPVWPTLAGASYRGPLNDSDLQYSVVVRGGPATISLVGVPNYVTPSKLAFFRTSLPQVVVAGDTVLDLGDDALVLDASNSSYLAGGELTYRWDLGDGTTVDGPRVGGHTFPADGSYDASLTVTASDGSTARRDFIIRSAPPALLGEGTRVFVNAGDFVSQSRGGLLVTPRVNSIGDMITYWSGDQMNKVTYRFDVEQPGRYVLVTKFANNSDEPTARAYWVDGKQPDEAMKNVPFPFTGGWSRFDDNWAWQTLSSDDGTPIAFDLAAGQHTLEVGNTAGGLGVDYFVFQLADGPSNAKEPSNAQR